MGKYSFRDMDACCRNHREAKAKGEVYHLPNGQTGTVLRCPWPGCGEPAVEGWSACGTHFDAVREADSFVHSRILYVVNGLPTWGEKIGEHGDWLWVKPVARRLPAYGWQDYEYPHAPITIRKDDSLERAS